MIAAYDLSVPKEENKILRALDRSKISYGNSLDPENETLFMYVYDNPESEDCTQKLAFDPK